MRSLIGLAGALVLAALGELIEAGRYSPRPWGWLLVTVALPGGRAAAHWLATRRSIRSQVPRPLRALVSESIDPVLFLVGLAVVLFPLGWVNWSLDHLGWRGHRFMTLLLGLLPAATLAGLLSPWAYLVRVRSRRPIEPPGFRTWLAGRSRLIALLVGILLTIVGVGDAIESLPGCEELLDVVPGLLVALAAVVLLVLFAISPLLFRLAIPTTRLPDGERRRLLEQMARTFGLRTPALRLWGDGRGGLLNACAVGLLPGTGLIALTRTLHDLLDPTEIAVVGAHELAHLRKRHLAFYLLLGLGFLLFLGFIEHLGGMWPAWGEIAAFVALLWCCWRLLFGQVSRLFELEADLVGARVVGGTAYASALQRVSLLVGPQARRGNWRHPGALDRIEVALSANDPETEGGITTRCRRARILILGILLAGMASFTWTLLHELRRPEAELALERARVALATAEEIRPVALARLETDDPGPGGPLRLLYRSSATIIEKYRSALERASAALEKTADASKAAELEATTRAYLKELEKLTPSS